MVDKSNNNENKSISAEAVYTHYQRNRPVNAQKTNSDTGVNTPIDSLTEGDAGFAENIFKHYQTTRSSDAQESIDAIMRKIHDQSISQVVSQEEQPSALSDTPQIHAIDVKPVSVNEQSQVGTPAANSSSIFKRWVLPGVAAAVLGIVLIPTLMNTGSNPESLHATLPTELSDQAEQAVAYIEPPASATFGFADTSNAAQIAFNNGVVATDLELLVEAKETSKTQQFLRTLVAAQNSAQQGSNPDDLVALSNSVKSSAVSLNEALGAGEGKAELREHVSAIGTALEAMAGATEQTDWFNAGRSVETIRVAAEYALEHSDTKPLDQALSVAGKMAQPASEAPASEVLPQLLKADLNGPEEFEIASELLNKANDIKLLMQ